MSTVQPLVSIIAICHNHSAFVLETLESIKKQTYSNIQLIIINNLNDSCEGLINQWLESYSNSYIFLQNKSPMDLVSNLNLGLVHVKGEYFQGISCDDIMLPFKIEKQVALFNSLSEDYACVYSDIVDIDEFGQKISYTYGNSLFDKRKHQGLYTDSFGSLKQQLQKSAYISAPSVLLKTNVIRKLGNYNKAYKFEDYPLWIKLERKGYKFAFIHDVSILQRQLPQSLGRTKSIMGKEFARLYLHNLFFFQFNLRRLIVSIKLLIFK